MLNLNDPGIIDFTQCKIRNKGYGGANGEKISIEYNGKVYMLKFPAIAKINKTLHYTNGCVSEYLGCHIFELLGIPAQETILGKYCKNGSCKEVIACRDLTFIDGYYSCCIQDFTATKNSVVDSSRAGRGTELDSILDAIEQQTILNPEEMLQWFWDMFIVDALIGNWDRHNGNWGVLYDQFTDCVLGPCPIFDCGSSLFPQADLNMMKSVLDDERELNVRVYERPLSAIMQNNRKINYYDFFMEHSYSDCDRALNRIVPRIDMKKMESLIHCTPGIPKIAKDFYIKVIRTRKECILDAATR